MNNKNSSGKLFVVATPIGNLKDITIRALETLKEVDMILAEDTRRALKLLNHYNIKKYIESFFVGNEYKKTPRIINYLLEGRNIALISESGTPCISDPGNYLISECHRKNIPVEPIPGPSAFVTALSISGIASMPSLFIGFLPRSKKKQNKLFEKLKDFEWNIILYESPHRLKKTLNLIKNYFGNLKIFLFKELTKAFECIKIDSVENILKEIEDNVKGEYVVIFNLKIY